MFEIIVSYLVYSIFLMFVMAGVVRYFNRQKEVTLSIYEDRQVKVKFVNGMAMWFAETETVETQHDGVTEILNIVRDKETGTFVHSLYSTPSSIMEPMELAVNAAGQKVREALCVYLRHDVGLVVVLSGTDKNGA